MSPQEFAAAWETGGLSPVARSVVQTAPLSEASKHFLEDAGLPLEAKPNLTFYAPPDALAPLPNVLKEIDFPIDFRRYLLLVDDGGTFLCIDTQEAGHIVSVDACQALPQRFVNSTLVQFAHCLLAYRTLPGPEQARGASKQEILEWLDQIKHQFNDIDPSALCAPDNW